MSKRLKLSGRHINRLANKDARLQAESIKINQDYMDNLSENSCDTNVDLTDTEHKHSDNCLHEDSDENQSLSSIQEKEPFSPEIFPSDFPSDVENNYSDSEFDEEVDFVNDLPADECYNEDNDEEYPLEYVEMLRKKKFISTIARWSILYKVKHVAVSALLIILRSYTDVNFPKNAKTLLKTPRKTIVTNMDNGEYFHFGLGSALEKVINLRKHLNKNESDKISLKVSTDGAPLSGSTRQTIWPIQISDSITNSVLIVGMYCGPDKPKDCNEFLEMFVNDAKHYLVHGFKYDEKKYSIEIDGYILDTPAKSYILNVQSHSGYNCCLKCTIHGEKLNGMHFPNENGTKSRDDEIFNNFGYPDLQHGKTILSKIPGAKLITQTPRDYMHLICQGVVRFIIKTMLFNTTVLKKLAPKIIKAINNKIENARNYQPTDFCRRLRSLLEIKNWKATEFRTFLLYIGPVVLKNLVPDKVYNNFIRLHVAIILLLDPISSSKSDSINFAEKLLKKFVEKCHKIYGNNCITHNIHNLLHLADDVRHFGSLDYFSAFKFENNLRLIKNNIKKNGKYLQQLVNRYSEREKFDINDFNFTKNETSNAFKMPIEPDFQGSESFSGHYNWYVCDKFTIKCNDKRDNCVLLDNNKMVRCMSFSKKNNKTYIIGQELKSIGDLYEQPIKSSKLGIHVVEEEAVLQCFKFKIKKKLFVLKHDNVFVALPLIHT